MTSERPADEPLVSAAPFDRPNKPRTEAEILAAETEYADRIWYERKLVLLENVKRGEETVDAGVLRDMRNAMRALEKKFGGSEHLMADSDFDWGMLNGKLSALRWVMGDDWDELST